MTKNEGRDVKEKKNELHKFKSFTILTKTNQHKAK